MNIAGNAPLLDRLAAEYVLGTLRGGARRRYDHLLRSDILVRRVTAEWQDRLHPMAQLASPVMPRAQVWLAIAATLQLPASAAHTSRRGFWRDLRDDLGFWRGLGVTSTVLATMLVVVLANQAPQPVAPATSYVALLTDAQAQPVAIVTGDARTQRLTVKVVLPQLLAANKSLQLWAVPKSGTPRSLGLVIADGSMSLALPAGTTPASVSLLAISLEQKGGSPNPNGPTGPIVFKGAWLQI